VVRAVLKLKSELILFIKNVNSQKTCALCRVLTPLTRRMYTLLLRPKHDISEVVILLIQSVDITPRSVFSITLHRFYKLLEPQSNSCFLVKEKACIFEKHHPMKTYGGMFHAFLTATLPAVEWSAFCVGCRIPRVSVPTCFWAEDYVGCSRSRPSGEQEGLYFC